MAEQVTGNQGQVTTPEVNQQAAAQTAQPVVTSQPVQVVTTPAPVEQKESFGQKLKKHWKGAAATVAAIAAAVGTGVIAHRKGVQAGMQMGMPMTPNDDGSYSPLDPNV